MCVTTVVFLNYRFKVELGWFLTPSCLSPSFSIPIPNFYVIDGFVWRRTCWFLFFKPRVVNPYLPVTFRPNDSDEFFLGFRNSEMIIGLWPGLCCSRNVKVNAPIIAPLICRCKKSRHNVASRFQVQFWDSKKRKVTCSAINNSITYNTCG